ncbi:hypothetical protein [Peredibacter starrii]|uniref:Uncharacterized protein n=1 Tax=Peredibacter starrii TaxID=28202 RepID=A0AAX4HS61_9BACT|nr:hypothetical protein [Peredibacter starrii]WPU66067.1 hypothetical protein SOO65_04845 [Peredibacter starrii]
MKIYLILFHLLMSTFFGGGIILAVAGHFKGEWTKFLRCFIPGWKWITMLWFIPLIALILMATHLYPWDGFHGHKATYFSIYYLLARQVIYIAALFVAYHFLRTKPWISLYIYFVVGTFFSYDWALSLETKWFSNLYGFIYLASGSLGALSVMLLTPIAPLEHERRDLVNLYVAISLFWFYLEFCQFLIVWMGNLPREVSWYVVRTQGTMLVLFIAVPILKLMPGIVLACSPKLKAKETLINICMWISLLGLVLEMVWFIWPSIKGGV